MVALKALIYAVVIFAALAVISLIVAGIMRLLYSVIRRGETKAKSENKAATKVS